MCSCLFRKGMAADSTAFILGFSAKTNYRLMTEVAISGEYLAPEVNGLFGDGAILSNLLCRTGCLYRNRRRRMTMPNDDLIYRDAAIAEIEEYIDEYSELDLKTGYHNLKWCAMEEAKDVLLTLPAVDAEPVRHGTWERKSCVKGKQYDPTTDYWAYAHRCSECDKVSYFPNDIQDKWCRHCGAKMDGDGNAR